MEPEDRFLTIDDVMLITSLSESTILRKVKAKTFPASVPVGERRVAWLQSEVRYWMEITYNKEYWQTVLAKNVVLGENGCWEWAKTRDRGFYGSIKMHPINKTLPAHRFAYELYREMVDHGQEMDHLCRNPCCVNPWHVDAVSRAENMRRVVPYMVGSKEPACYFGHAFTEENTIPRPHGQRMCRACLTDLATKGVDEHGTTD